MQKLPESFEKEYRDLMIPIMTDGTSKARRNLIVASFIVCSLYFLGKSLSGLRVLGFSLEGADQIKIFYIALILIVFWLVLFVVNWWKDYELNQERKRLLVGLVDQIREHKERLEQQCAKVKDDNNPNIQRMRSLQREYDRFKSQSDRTKTARQLTGVTIGVDLVLPLILALVSAGLLVSDIFAYVPPSS